MRFVLSSKEIAAELGISVSTLINWRATNDSQAEGMPTFKLCNCNAHGKHRCNHEFYVTAQDFRKWIEGKKAVPGNIKIS